MTLLALILLLPAIVSAKVLDTAPSPTPIPPHYRCERKDFGLVLHCVANCPHNYRDTVYVGYLIDNVVCEMPQMRKQ